MPRGSGRSNSGAQAGAYLIVAMIEGLVRATAMTVEACLHSGFGHVYVGCGQMGVFVIIIFTSLFPNEAHWPMFWFATIYGMRWLYLAIQTFIRYRRGKELAHSRYNGRPYLCTLLSSWKEMNVKLVEAMAVIVLGFFLHYLNRPLGDYLMTAATLVLIRAYQFDMQQRDRAVDLNDCVIEQKIAAEQLRDMLGR